jgi:Bacteriophage protein gp37
MRTTKIEWTDRTWNPVTGCTKQSTGCAHCYAETMARRLHAMGLKKYENSFTLTLHPEDLEEPNKWKKGSNIFVCSMSDLFHPDVPFEFIDKVMETIEDTPQHRYQLLTKRAERMAEYFSNHEVPGNAWLGVTVECKQTRSRIEALQSIDDATVRFLSCEPLLEDLGDLDLTGIHWMIVGGESGAKARPMQESWVLNLKVQAKKHKVSFFFKQWGTWGRDGVKRSKHANGKDLDGKLVQQMP